MLRRVLERADSQAFVTTERAVVVPFEMVQLLSSFPIIFDACKGAPPSPCNGNSSEVLKWTIRDTETLVTHMHRGVGERESLPAREQKPNPHRCVLSPTDKRREAFTHP